MIMKQLTLWVAKQAGRITTYWVGEVVTQSGKWGLAGGGVLPNEACMHRMRPGGQ
jgi:hypothetical protein